MARNARESSTTQAADHARAGRSCRTSVEELAALDLALHEVAVGAGVEARRAVLRRVRAR